jgi:hypothetical protein
MGVKIPDGRVLKSYNLSYVFPDGFKDLLILDEALRRVDKPDLIIFTVNDETFLPLMTTHWLAQANPDAAIRLKQQYNLSEVPLDGVSDQPWLATHNFWAERSDVVAWLTNQAYGITWAETQIDYPKLAPVAPRGYGGHLDWENKRPGVLNAIAALAAQYKIPLLLISTPIDYTTPFSPWIQGQARELNIPLLDCSALLPPNYFTNTKLHINAAGHLRFAKLVASWLQNWLNDPKLNEQTVTFCPAWRLEM